MPYFNPSYTNRDFDSIKQQLVSLIPQITPNWTDFNESDIGMALVELIAAYGDMQSFQLDMQALETYLPTVQQRQNAQNILNLINYKMSGYSAEQTEVVITQNQFYQTPVSIPAYFQLSTQGTTPIYYVTSSPLTFNPPSTYPLFQDTLTEYTSTPSSWVVSGSFNYTSSGVVSTANGSTLSTSTPSTYSPQISNNGISNPIVLTAEFQIPSTLNSFWLNLNDPNGNYYQAMVSTSQLSLVRYLNSASTTLSSSPITLQTNTLYVLSLSYDKNGHVTVSLYPESTQNTPVSTITYVDNTITSTTSISVGANQGITISNVVLSCPPSYASNFSVSQTVNAWSGQVKSYTLTYTDISSDGTYTLSDQQVDISTVYFAVGNTVWTQVQNVLYQTNTSTVYSVSFVNDYPVIQLTPNWQTYINSNSPPITLMYVVTNGPADAVGANTITNFVSPIYDANGVNVTSMFSVTNPQASSGGSLPETIDQARQLAPSVAFQQQTLITLSDYETAVKNYPGVYDVYAMDCNTPGAGITQTLYVEVIVVPTGFSQPSNAFLQSIQQYLSEKSLPGMTIVVNPPQYYTVNFTITAYVPNAYSSFNSQVQSAITSALQNYFQPKNLGFNSVLRYSILNNVVQTSSQYISYIEMSPSSDVQIPFGYYPLLGNISVSVVNI